MLPPTQARRAARCRLLAAIDVDHEVSTSFSQFTFNEVHYTSDSIRKITAWVATSFFSESIYWISMKRISRCWSSLSDSAERWVPPRRRPSLGPLVLLLVVALGGLRGVFRFGDLCFLELTYPSAQSAGPHHAHFLSL